MIVRGETGRGSNAGARVARFIQISLAVLVAALSIGCGAEFVEFVLIAGVGQASPGTLLVLDAKTGEPLGAIDTFASCDGSPCEIGRPGSIAWHRNAHLLVLGMGGGGPFAGSIVVVDPRTGEASLLWSNAIIQEAVGGALSVDAVGGLAEGLSGTFYATVKSGEGGPVGLIRFSLTEGPMFLGVTGVASEVGAMFDLGNALTFDGATLLYTTGAGLSKIDPATANATHLGPVTYAGFPPLDENPDFTRINSMATLPNGRIAAVLDDDEARYFGFLDPDTRVFSTTGFWGGLPFEADGLMRVTGLGAMPDAFLPDELDAPPYEGGIP